MRVQPREPPGTLAASPPRSQPARRDFQCAAGVRLREASETNSKGKLLNSSPHTLRKPQEMHPDRMVLHFEFDLSEPFVRGAALVPKWHGNLDFGQNLTFRSMTRAPVASLDQLSPRILESKLM